jgi:uncharacterized protein (TIGR03083 family)
MARHPNLDDPEGPHRGRPATRLAPVADRGAHVDPDRGPSPSELADLVGRLRADSCATLAQLTDAELATPALPGWSVADVYRHLASLDRSSVTGKLLINLLPGRQAEELEPINDELVEQLRDLPREQLAEDLEVWGRRFVRLLRSVPRPLASVRVPSAFGTVPLVWLGTLRLYDEWVHQADIAAALGRQEPAMDRPTRDVLAWFQRRALPAEALGRITHDRGVVELELRDAIGPTWRLDLANRRFGAHVAATPSVRVRAGVAAFCLVAADRRPWRELEEEGRIELTAGSGEGELTTADRRAAEALLDVVRVV